MCLRYWNNDVVIHSVLLLESVFNLSSQQTELPLLETEPPLLETEPPPPQTKPPLTKSEIAALGNKVHFILFIGRG